MNDSDFLKIFQSVDAFFPVGAFTLSNGLEDYVLSDRIRSEADLAAYLKGFLQVFPYQDLGLLSLAYKNAGDKNTILELDQIAGAMKNAKEIRAGSMKMGSRYIKAREAIGDMDEPLRWYYEKIREKQALGFHPIAVGIYGAGLLMDRETLLLMYGYSVISAIVNNAVKLVPLSQMGGQKILYGQLLQLTEAVKKAEEMEINWLGVSGAACEIHCMNHEHLYSRQYMS